MEKILTDNDYLNSLAAEAYKQAKVTGWHRDLHSKEHYLCLIISELMEAVQADRVDRTADLLAFKDCYDFAIMQDQLTGIDADHAYIKWYNKYVKDCLEDELADACIRIFDMAGYMGIRLDICKDTVVHKEFSFTENIFNITKVLAENNASVHIGLNVALSNIIRLAELKKIVNFDEFIQLKMKYNAIRPYMHGCKKY